MKSIEFLLYELVLISVVFIFIGMVMKEHQYVATILEKFGNQPSLYPLARAYDLSLIDNCGGSATSFNFSAVSVSGTFISEEGEEVKIDLAMEPLRGVCE